MNIENFTANYSELEDRIFFIVNHTNIQMRIDFMITRSFILRLFPVLEEYYIKHYQKALELKDLTQVQNKTETTKSNHTVSQTPNSDLALTKVAPTLLSKIDLTYQTKSKNTHLVFHGLNAQKAETMIDEEMFIMLVSAIENAIPKMSWGINAII
jgi:hypothetical protein